MKTELAIFGGQPVFDHEVRERHLLPPWNEFENIIDGIFDRRYYTNHGPLALDFEKRFKEFFGVNNALYMTNSGIALMIVSRGLDVKGKVILPAFSHVSAAQAIIWAGGQPVYCDVDENTMHLDVAKAEKLIDKDTCAILGVNLFGGCCEYDKIDALAAKHSIADYYLSDDLIGAQYRNRKAGTFGKLEVFSLHESKIINTGNGCVVTCNDDALAEKIRHIRSSYGLGKPTPVAFTGNGRMSEIVAGMALNGLDKFETHVVGNRKVHEAYERALGSVRGLKIYQPDSTVSHSNYHRLIVRVNKEEFGLDASGLARVLQAENIRVNRISNFAVNANAPYSALTECPVACALADSLLEFPMNRDVLKNDGLDKLAGKLSAVKQNAGRITSAVHP